MESCRTGRASSSGGYDSVVGNGEDWSFGVLVVDDVTAGSSFPPNAELFRISPLRCRGTQC